MAQYELALPYSEKAVAIMEIRFPDGHPKLTLYKHNLDSIRKIDGEKIEVNKAKERNR